MVQDALSRGMENLLSNIPPDQRLILQDYILQFKDAYLANLAQTSSSIGIFALFILIWVGMQAFNNLDSTLNYLWSSDRSRPFAEKARNFIVVSVVAPIVLLAGFSIPFVLHRFSVTRFFLERVTLLGVLLNYVIPFFLVFGTFLVMYRYLPVCRVWWRSAFWGALFATVTLELTNLLMRVYFLLGTNSAYGKAAAVPLIGFWIYALWIVVILGAQISFLIQNEEGLFVGVGEEPTLRQGQGLLILLTELSKAFYSGKGTVPFDALRRSTDLDSIATRYCLKYLMQHKLVVECIDEKTHQGGEYALARELDSVSLPLLLKNFFEFPSSRGNLALKKAWQESVQHWLKYFEKTSVSDLAK
jgi:membrane protein